MHDSRLGVAALAATKTVTMTVTMTMTATEKHPQLDLPDD